MRNANHSATTIGRDHTQYAEWYPEDELTYHRYLAKHTGITDTQLYAQKASVRGASGREQMR